MVVYVRRDIGVKKAARSPLRARLALSHQLEVRHLLRHVWRVRRAITVIALVCRPRQQSVMRATFAQVEIVWLDPMPRSALPVPLVSLAVHRLSPVCLGRISLWQDVAAAYLAWPETTVMGHRHRRIRHVQLEATVQQEALHRYRVETAHSRCRRGRAVAMSVMLVSTARMQIDR